MPRSQSLIASFLVGVAVLAGSGLFAFAAAQDAGQAKVGNKEDTEKTIRELIKQLGDDSFERREEAVKRLSAIGEPALKLLEKEALESKDAEVRERADTLALGISQPRFFLISLRPKANLKRTDSLGNIEGNNLANLPTGIKAYGKKWFKVEDSVIQLSGTRVKNNRPAKVEAIQVNRGLARLHILHGTTSGGQGKAGDANFVADGTLIGKYTIHYADGTKAVIPIEYGKDVRDYNNQDSSKAVGRGSIAWTGTNSVFSNVRLYVCTWENPTPSKRIARIDYHSMNTVCAPFCVAMSAEAVPSKLDDPTHAAAIAWRFRESMGLSGPLVMDDLVVVGNDQGLLRALRKKDATEAWSHKHEERIYDAPTCDSEHVYFSSTRGVVALSRKDGKIQWNHLIEHGAGPCMPLEGKGLVFAGGSDGFIYAFDAKKGAVQWKANIVSDAPPDPPGFSGQRARSSNGLARPTGVACDSETVYQSIFDQARVVAIDVATGKLRWSYQTGGWIYGAPGVSTDHVLVASQDKFLHCLDKQTGKMLWKFATASRNEATPVVENQSVFFGSCDGGIYRLNLADGKQFWKYDTEPDYTGGRPIYSMPILTQDTLYLAAMEGHLYALDKKTGNFKWRLRAAGFSEIEHGAASDGRHLFVVTRPDWDKRGESSLVAITLK